MNMATGVSAEMQGAALYRYMAIYAVTILSITAIWGGVGHLLLALHIQQIEFARIFTGVFAALDLHQLSQLKLQVDAGLVHPTAEQSQWLELLARYEAAKAASLSWVTSVGVFVTMLSQPVVGLLSDRTRSRWGRRGPWIIGGCVLAACTLAVLCVSATIGAIIALWAVASTATNAASGPLAATVPDRVPRHMVGMVSAVNGLGYLLGLVLGMVVAGALFNRIGVSSYLPFAVMVVLCGVGFVWIAREASSVDMTVRRASWAQQAGSLTVALRDADYRWVWLAKVVIMFGYSVAGTFSVYMLQSYIQPALNASDAARTAPLLHVAALPGALVAMLVAGRWSDRVRRRKPFVVGASLLLALSMLIAFQWATLWAMYLQAILAGIAVGIFVVVDQALFIDVLPDRQAVGRDLGLANLAGGLGQAIGPAVAGVVLSWTGGYRMIWLVAFFLVLVAAVAVLPVKRAK